MMPQIQETNALQTHVGNLKYALATTTCRETHAVLEKMLSAAEAKLCQMDTRPPKGTGRTNRSRPHHVIL